MTSAGYNSPCYGRPRSRRPCSTASRPPTARGRPRATVSAARETLRITEQTVLLNAATAYMNLLRDTAILDLQRRNVEVLQEQLRQTRDRFNVGEVTRTDVAQAESRLAAGRSQVLTAESNYTTSRATYRQVIGVEPGKLAPASPVDRLLAAQSCRPRSSGARRRHPAVTHRDVQRRCRAAAGEDRGRRALSDARPSSAAPSRTTARPVRARRCCKLRPRCSAS